MPDIFWTRIENWAVPGVPDCYGCKDGVMFWVELKITKDKKVKLSPFQKAWHFNHAKQGGRSFIMLHSLAESLSCIFPSSIAVSHAALTSSIASYTHAVPGDPSSWQRAQRELLHCPLPPSPQKPYIPSKQCTTCSCSGNLRWQLGLNSIGEKPSISEASQDPGTLHQQPGTGVAGTSASCIGAEAGSAGVQQLQKLHNQTGMLKLVWK